MGRAWKDCFSPSPEEILRNILSDWEPRASAPFDPVPEVIRHHIEEHVASLIGGSRAFTRVRRDALRALGGGGYVCRPELLVEVYSDPQDPLRSEALRAMENLSGELLGEDAAAWRDYWQRHPAPSP